MLEDPHVRTSTSTDQTENARPRGNSLPGMSAGGTTELITNHSALARTHSAMCSDRSYVLLFATKRLHTLPPTPHGHHCVHTCVHPRCTCCAVCCRPRRCVAHTHTREQFTSRVGEQRRVVGHHCAPQHPQISLFALVAALPVVLLRELHVSQVLGVHLRTHRHTRAPANTCVSSMRTHTLGTDGRPPDPLRLRGAPCLG